MVLELWIAHRSIREIVNGSRLKLLALVSSLLLIAVLFYVPAG
jgi:hypothetical protein